MPAAEHDMTAMPQISGEMSKSAMSGMKTDKSGMPGMRTAGRDSAEKNAPSAAAAAAAPHDMSAMGGKMDDMNMGGNVPASSKFVATLITLLMLAGGGFIAARYGDLSMRAGEMNHEAPLPTNMQMENMQH